MLVHRAKGGGRRKPGWPQAACISRQLSPKGKWTFSWQQAVLSLEPSRVPLEVRLFRPAEPGSGGRWLPPWLRLRVTAPSPWEQRFLVVALARGFQKDYTSKGQAKFRVASFLKHSVYISGIKEIEKKTKEKLFVKTWRQALWLELLGAARLGVGVAGAKGQGAACIQVVGIWANIESFLVRGYSFQVAYLGWNVPIKSLCALSWANVSISRMIKYSS